MIAETYGDGAMSRQLVDNLVSLIDSKMWDDRGRERMVMVRCWDWFPGGSTAEAVAAKIEQRLDAFESGAFL